MNLGTDIHGDSVLAPVVKPVIMLLFAVIIAMFFTRIINSFPVFDDQTEVNLAAVLIVLILVITTTLSATWVAQNEQLSAASARMDAAAQQLSLQETQIATLTGQNVSNASQVLHG